MNSEKIRAVIIDDEKDSRDIIRIYLKEYYPAIIIVGEVDSVTTGVELLAHETVDLLFLDIQLRNNLSFEILKQLKDYSFEIIFVTAHNEYAIQAIKHHAFDYLLKPIEREEFKIALTRYFDLCSNEKPRDILRLVTNLETVLQRKQIKLPTLTGFKIVIMDSIIYLKSDSNYTHVFMDDGTKLLVSRTLKEYELQLPKNDFCRIHHSCIINVNFIKEYIKGRGGQVVLQNDIILSVSQNKKSDLFKHWN